MSKSNDDLLKELDAEFGKAARKKPKELTDADIRKQRNRAFHQRIDGASTVEALQQYANANARSWLEVPGFRATRRITNVQHEHCLCCGGSVSYIGNEFVEFFSKRLRASVQAAELITHDENGIELPRDVEEWHHDVQQCVACLRLSRRIEDCLVSLNVKNGSAVQLEIFH